MQVKPQKNSKPQIQSHRQTQNNMVMDSLKVALYRGQSQHERKVLSIIRRVSDSLCPTDQDSDNFFTRFSSWAPLNKNATKIAGTAVLNALIERKANMASISQMVDLYLCAFHQFGVSITEEMAYKIKRLRQLTWDARDSTRHRALQDKKAVQTDLLCENYEAILGVLSTWVPSRFREQLMRVSNNPAKHSSMATSVLGEMTTLARKSDDDLQHLMFGAAAYMSIAVATGARPTSISQLRLNDIEWFDKTAQLILLREEHKVGSQRNVTKVVRCCVVPNKRLEICSLVHLARHLNASKPSNYVFNMGFKSTTTSSFSTMVLRRIAALLETACVAAGLPSGLGVGKKLHIFRTMCNKALVDGGATGQDIEAHIGWTSTIRTKHYQSSRTAALGATTPYLLAGRRNKDDPPHPTWRFWNNDTTAWYTRLMVLVDTPDERVKAYVARVERGEIMDGGENNCPEMKKAKKRLRDKDDEIALLRAQVSKLQKGTGQGSAKERLTCIVDKLKTRARDSTFPELCLEALPRLIATIEEVNSATKGRGFGIPLSSATGKGLRGLLLTAGAMSLDDRAFVNSRPQRGRSWLSFIDKNRNGHPVIKRVSVDGYDKFKETIKKIM